MEVLESSGGHRTLRRRSKRAIRGATTWVEAHETELWWGHSLWALAFGIGVMWLGARDFRYLRLALLHLAFIWATSMALPFIVRSGALSSPWRRRAQLFINYCNKNFYQQLLFFILPIYWRSTTASSPNVLFLALIATAALLSTMDLVYDRHVAMRRALTALFFAFSVFAGAAAALPILWKIESVDALWWSAVIGGAGATTLVLSERRIDWQRTWFAGGLIVLSLFVLVEYGRPFIPPAPLRLQQATFGTQVDTTRGPHITSPVDGTPSDARGQVYVVTAIYAPQGLHDRVRHVWYHGPQQIKRTRYYDVDFGRGEGYRLWSPLTLTSALAGRPLRVDVETEGGQLIGRAWLPGRP